MRGDNSRERLQLCLCVYVCVCVWRKRERECVCVCVSSIYSTLFNNYIFKLKFIKNQSLELYI